MSYKKGMHLLSGGFSHNIMYAFGILIIVAVYFAFFHPILTGFYAIEGGAGYESMLIIYDETDTESVGKTAYSQTNITFYANYSNSSDSEPINGTGIYCELVSNMSGMTGPINLSYNTSSEFFEYTKNISRKGDFNYNITCEGTSQGYDDLMAQDNFTVENTFPVISTKPLPPKTCWEDSECSFDFASYVSDVDSNDVLNYSRSTDTYFDPFSMNTQTGIINFSATNSGQNQSNYTMVLIVMDSDSAPDSVNQDYAMIAVNDAPVPVVCSNLTAVEDTAFLCDINATDEENNEPYEFFDNATFFNIDNDTGIISFTPTNSEVGTHNINITVNDSLGALGETTITMIIRGTNDAPVFSYTCNNETNATENIEFTCYLNASDVDLTDNLTFSANESWFSFNTSPQSAAGENVSLLVNFTPTDNSVGNHTITFTVSDDFSAQDTATINFTVDNVIDYPMFNNLTNLTVYGFTNYTGFVNASDDDTLTQAGDTIYYYSNSSLFTINETTGYFFFNPLNNDSGNYTINFTLNDTYGYENSSAITLTLENNNPPALVNVSQINITSIEGKEYYYNLSLNITDAENDPFNCTDNSTFFNITVNCVINFTTSDSYVMNHTPEINLTDIHGAVNTTMINIEVLNEDDAPQFTNISNMTAYEDTQFTYDVEASDDDENVPGSTENLTYYSNFTLSSINPATGVIVFTPNVLQVGEYSVNISVYDTTNLYDEETITINVTAVNDDPVLAAIGDQVATEDEFYNLTLTATDEEGDNLTFSSNATWMTIVRVNDSQALINFTPNNSLSGNHTVNITVNDNSTGKDWEVISFYVNGSNDAPNITYWRWDNTTATSNNSIGGSNLTSFNATENTTLTFNHTSEDDDGDTLTYSWYFDNHLNATTMNWTYWLNSSCDGQHNVTLNVSDPSGAFDWVRWEINVSNINSAPDFTKNISNQTWSEDSWNQNIDLDDHFRDPDGDRLDFTYNGTSQISVSIDNETNLVTLIPAADWYGTEYITFIANDSQYNTSSNLVMLNVTPVESENVVYVTVPVSTGGGSTAGTSTNIKTVSMEINVESFREITPFDNVDIEVLVSNTGEMDIENVTISTYSTYDDIIPSVDKSDLGEFKTGDNETVTLNIQTRNLTQKRYDIMFWANATSPELNVSSRIYLSIFYVNQSQAEIIIKFARDLFEENPECMELFELILESEKRLKQGKNEEAIDLTKRAIENCRDILSTALPDVVVDEEPQPEVISYDPLIVTILLFSILIVLVIILLLFLKNKIGKKQIPSSSPFAGTFRQTYPQ